MIIRFYLLEQLANIGRIKSYVVDDKKLIELNK